MKNLEKIRKQIEKALNQPEPLRESYLGGLVVENLLLEAGFNQYKALVRVTYSRDRDEHIGAEKVAEMLRAVPGGTRVSTVKTDREHDQTIYTVRVVSQKPAKQCFMSFKQTCLRRYRGIITNVEIGAGSIEEKRFIR